MLAVIEIIVGRGKEPHPLVRKPRLHRFFRQQDDIRGRLHRQRHGLASLRYLRRQESLHDNIGRESLHAGDARQVFFHRSAQGDTVIQIIETLLAAVEHLVHPNHHCRRIGTQSLDRELLDDRLPVVILNRAGYGIPLRRTHPGIPGGHPYLVQERIPVETDQLVLISHPLVQPGVIQLVRNAGHLVHNQQIAPHQRVGHLEIPGILHPVNPEHALPSLRIFQQVFILGGLFLIGFRLRFLLFYTGSIRFRNQENQCRHRKGG